MSPLIIGCFLIIFNCGINNFTLELMLAEDKGFGPLLTLCQYLFISTSGFIEHFDFHSLQLKERAIPLWFYACQAALFMIIQLFNSISYGFGVAQPLVLCLRSSSLAISFVLGIFVGRKYNFGQFWGVLFTSFGVALTVVADSALHVCQGCSWSESVVSIVDISTKVEHGKSVWFGLEHSTAWVVGVSLLVITLMMSAGLGHLQEYSYKRWAKKPREAMFYSHLLALPMFFLLSSELQTSFSRWLMSEPLVVAGINLGPKMIVYLFANVLTQWACIRSVYLLTSIAGTLSCTLTLTLRKFLSLLLSVWYFSNLWTSFHWLGTVSVFVGVLTYAAASRVTVSTDIKSEPAALPTALEQKKKQ